MKKYVLINQILRTIEKKHIKTFGWVGKGNLSKIYGKNSYMLYDSFPPLDMQNYQEKVTNLRKVVAFYSAILNTYEAIEEAEIKIETPDQFKRFARSYEVIFEPSPKEGALWIGVGFAKEEHPYIQIDKLIQKSKEEIRKTLNIIKKAQKEMPGEIWEKVLIGLNHPLSKNFTKTM